MNYHQIPQQLAYFEEKVLEFCCTTVLVTFLLLGQNIWHIQHKGGNEIFSTQFKKVLVHGWLDPNHKYVTERLSQTKLLASWHPGNSTREEPQRKVTSQGLTSQSHPDILKSMFYQSPKHL